MAVLVKVRGETQVLLTPQEFQEQSRQARERWISEREREEALRERTQQGNCREPLPGRLSLSYGERWNPSRSWKDYRPHQYKVG